MEWRWGGLSRGDWGWELLDADVSRVLERNFIKQEIGEFCRIIRISRVFLSFIGLEELSELHKRAAEFLSM